jgi:hypothetical protein
VPESKVVTPSLPPVKEAPEDEIEKHGLLKVGESLHWELTDRE